MKATFETSPVYGYKITDFTTNAKQYGQTLVFDEIGNVKMTNDDTESEALQRIYSYRDTFAFNNDYGCLLTENINKRTISNNEVVLQVRQALAPMVQQGKITDNIIVLPTINNYKISVDITLISQTGKQYQFVFESYLIN